MPDDNYVYKLVSFNCFYCGGTSDRGWNGLDRVDSNGIYEPTNVLPACSLCNGMKSSHDIDQFMTYCSKTEIVLLFP